MREGASFGPEPPTPPGPQRGRRRASLPLAFLAAAGLGAAALRLRPALEAADAGFEFPAATTPQVVGPEISVDLPPFAPAVHAPALVVLPGGELLVAWYAGTREAATDVSIRMARLSGKRVVAAWEGLTSPRLEQMVRRRISKLGNPVLWVSPDGAVHLFVVSVSFGGWSGSAVNHLLSADGGRTWLSARRLVLSPFLNLSTLVRTRPVPLDDGSLLLPAYHELIHTWGITVRLTPDGTVAGVSRIPGDAGLLQPAVAPVGRRRATALLRSAAAARPRTFQSTTEDSGASWSPAGATGIPNRDTSVAVVRLADGRLLAAAETAEKAGSTLTLLLSEDGGDHWHPARTVEAAVRPTDRFAYPVLAQSPGGAIHLAYSVNRRTIRVRTFDPSTLAARPGKAGL